MTALSAKVREVGLPVGVAVVKGLSDSYGTSAHVRIPQEAGTQLYSPQQVRDLMQQAADAAIAERLARVEVLEALLRAAVCPMAEHGCDGTQYPVGDPHSDYWGEQCQWCYERNAALPPPPSDAGGE